MDKDTVEVWSVAELDRGETDVATKKRRAGRLSAKCSSEQETIRHRNPRKSAVHGLTSYFLPGKILTLAHAPRESFVDAGKPARTVNLSLLGLGEMSAKGRVSIVLVFPSAKCANAENSTGTVADK